MNDSILLFSDLHMREDSADVCGEVLRGIRDEALERKISTIGFLGDWWHLRYTVPVRLLNAVADELSLWASCGLQTIILPGNHDQVDVHGRNALEVFGEFPGVKVYTAPTADEWGLWIPYRHEESEVQAVLRKYFVDPLPGDRTRGANKSKGYRGCVYIHGAIKGAMMNNLTRSETGLDAEVFAGYRRVVLGHFHKRQRWEFAGGWAQYVGSPWQTKADEAGQPKGFAIFNGDTIEFVDRNWGPKHRKIVVGSVEELRAALAETSQADKVRVIVRQGGDLDKIAKAVGKLKLGSAVVEPEAIENRAPRLAADMAGGLREHAARYVELMAGDLDPTELLREFDGLTA